VTRWEIILGFSAHILFWVADIVQWEFEKTEENRAEKVSRFGALEKNKTLWLDGSALTWERGVHAASTWPCR